MVHFFLCCFFTISFFDYLVSVIEIITFFRQKIVKQVLPQCGDFFVQASIVEILYRLSKKHVHLLDALEDRKLKEMIISLHKVKKPDLHAQTRDFLEHLNGSLGLSRRYIILRSSKVNVDISELKIYIYSFGFQCPFMFRRGYHV